MTPLTPITPPTTTYGVTHHQLLLSIVPYQHPRLTRFHIGVGSYRASIGTRKRTRAEAGLIGNLEQVQDP